MRGHEAILRLRLNGTRPQSVFVYVLAGEPARGSYDAESAIANDCHPEIDVGASDIPALLDLRCLRGTTVHVVGKDESRVRAVARRAVEFAPLKVICNGASGLIIWNRK